MAWTLSSAGLVSPATFSNSGNANTMDDYEEGTWSPVPANAGTYTVNGANYTKLGRLVNLCCKISYGDTFYPSPLTGAPFTASQFSSGSIYSVGMNSNVTSDNSVFDMCMMSTSATDMNYNSWERNTLGTPQCSSGDYAVFQMTYETAS